MAQNSNRKVSILTGTTASLSLGGDQPMTVCASVPFPLSCTIFAILQTQSANTTTTWKVYESVSYNVA